MSAELDVHDYHRNHVCLACLQATSMEIVNTMRDLLHLNPLYGEQFRTLLSLSKLIRSIIHTIMLCMATKVLYPRMALLTPLTVLKVAPLTCKTCHGLSTLPPASRVPMT